MIIEISAELRRRCSPEIELQHAGRSHVAGGELLRLAVDRSPNPWMRLVVGGAARDQRSRDGQPHSHQREPPVLTAAGAQGRLV